MAAVRRQAVRSDMLAIGDGVAWLTLPRDYVDQVTAQAVCDVAERIAFDESVCVTVVQGSGRRFCLGVERAGEWQARHDWVAAIAAITVPVVAAIAGDAVAEGAELALACDLHVV